MSRFSPLSGVVLGLLISSGVAVADTPNAKVGRLPDGRAYRTDTQGYRLVDQVAEMELNISDLQRQVQALENELSQKTARISELERGKCSSTVQETSLLQHQPKREENTKAFESKIRSLETENSEHKVTVERLNARIAELERENKTLEVASRQQDEAPKAIQRAESAPEPQQVARRAPAAPAEPTTRAMMASAGPETRAGLKRVFAEIDQLILRRKNLIDSLKASKKGVAVQIQPLVSKSGISLDTLRLKASNRLPEEATQIEAGVSEIRNILEEDIRVMERLAKL